MLYEYFRNVKTISDEMIQQKSMMKSYIYFEV